ncbi:MAG TPA: substrate-binding domain-containing protein [Trebonia sp.]|nr:substrate-binding domain-containing protein [Trebonia sp.]
MTHRWMRWLAPGATLTAAALLAACSSSSSSSTSASSSTGASGSPSATSTAPAGLAAAQKMVAQLEGTTSSYPVPTADVPGVSKFAGKTVFYIPLDAHIPGFVVTAATMKTALTKAGLKFQECDGQGNPSAIASCVSQAQGVNAAGIVLDAIPYGMAQNALDGAKAKGIPIIVTDQYSQGAQSTNQVAYVQGVVDQPSQIAYWLIASSGGKASAIIGEEEDSPSSIAYVQNALPIFKQDCPDCHIVVKPITASMSDQQITAAVTSNVQTDPTAQYYYTEFEDSLQDTVSGIQAAGKASSVGIAVAGGSVNGLGLLKSGQLVKAVVAVDQPYAGWALTDEILRMMTKSGPVTETFPSRLFDAVNIGSVQVTSAAQDSGAWFGDDSYQASFEKLWGVG